MLNPTFIHANRDNSRAAAVAGGWDLDDLLTSVDATGKWGWTLIENMAFPCSLIAPPEFRAADAPPLPDENVDQPAVTPEAEVVTAGEVENLTDVQEPHQDQVGRPEEPAAVVAEHLPADEPESNAATPVEPTAHPSEVVAAAESTPPPVVSTPTAADSTPTAEHPSDSTEEPVRETAPGDLVLQINGPMLPAAAKLRALTFARQLGLQITLRDATTLAIVEVVKGVKRGRGGDPTDLIIELCTRPEGATGPEINEAAKLQGSSVGKLDAALKKAAETGGYTMTTEAVIRGKSAKIAFFFSSNEDAAPIAEAAD